MRSDSNIYRLLKSIGLITLLVTVYTLSSCPAKAARSGEQGVTFLQTFGLEETGGASQNFSVTQDSLGLVYVANLMSVLEYDGGRWRRIPHPGNLRPVSLDVGPSGRLYVGFQGDIGYMVTDSRGRHQVVSLRSQVPDSIKDIGYIWSTLSTHDGVFFRSPHRLYRWRPNLEDIKFGEMKVWSFPEKNKLLGLSEIRGRTLFWQNHVGLMEVVDDKCVPLKGGDYFAEIPVRNIVEMENGSLLLACESDGLYTFDWRSAKPFNSEANQFAKKLFAVGCTRVQGERFAMATRYGGLIIFDQEGRIRRVLDKSLGLPDNNILSTPFIDSQNALWLPLNYGIARVETPSSLEFYDYNVGMEGNINSITRFAGSLYVATSQGLRVLKSSAELGYPAQFELVEGAEERCWNLLTMDNRLYAVNAKGLIEVFKDNRQPGLIREIPMAYCIIASADSSHLFVGSYTQGVHSFRAKGSEWIYEGPLDGTSRQVLLMESTRNGELWLMANYRHVERVQFDISPTTPPRNVEVDIYDTAHGLPAFSHYYPLVIEGDFFVGSPNGLYQFEENIDRFIPSTILGESFGTGERGMWNITRDPQGNVWFNSQFAKGARVTPGKLGSYELNYPLLRASQSSFLCFYPEEKGMVLWAGGENGRLIRYDERFAGPDSAKFKALIRRVTVGVDSIVLDGLQPSDWEVPKIPYDSNNLRFEYTIPRYDAPEANKYQYRLTGLNDSWSDWSHESYRDFNSLPEGKYKFEVRGHDVFYFKSAIDSFDFIILPPWYRTAWAFGLYIILCAGALYGIYKWRVRSIEAYNRHLEHLVKERTDELERANDTIQEYNTQLERMLERRTRSLMRSERQAVFGQMVQGIVHNLRNPLTSSTMSTELIRMAVKKSKLENVKSNTEQMVMLQAMGETVEVAVGWIEKANETLSGMINSLLTKSRSDKGEDRKVIDLNHLIRTEIDFLQADPTFKNKIRKEIILSDDPLYVNLVPGEMAQIFQNLIRNAMDAMYRMPDPSLKIETLKDGSQIELRISDTGNGIPEDIRDHIFDPFFSTKQPEGEAEPKTGGEPKGTGLGLWMCQEAVKSFNGTITFKSKVGLGTTFIITFPESVRKEQFATD
ncbi:hypothetical protein K8I28_09855 [bacterium]|nr:hypothetical protein [bacterium]